MLQAYRETAGRFERLGPTAALADATWIDLYQPEPAQIAALRTLGIEVPTLADMEEIEISNRLYRENGTDTMTVVLPGLSQTHSPMVGPVAFILTAARLVTVRHHVPRPFETYPERADKAGPGCTSPARIFLGLSDEIIGRLADLLEGAGRDLDTVSQLVFRPGTGARRPKDLQTVLERVGQSGDLLGRVRLALLTLERALGFFAQGLPDHNGADGLHGAVKALIRDIQALEVHGDFLTSRVQLATDATLGMINLVQSSTVRIVSVVAVLFSPPTLIASIYGMNFPGMPEINHPWGYPASLALMVVSAAATYLFFKWRHWL